MKFELLLVILLLLLLVLVLFTLKNLKESRSQVPPIRNPYKFDPYGKEATWRKHPPICPHCHRLIKTEDLPS